MNKLQFLEKARNQHGYKYNYPNLDSKVRLTDYIQVQYLDMVFSQKVSKHLSGSCPERKVEKKSTQDFINESKQLWGDKYDYSLVEYTGALNKVKIIFDGVVYEQRPVSHLLGKAPEFRKNEDSILKDLIRKSDSYGEEEIERFLQKYNIRYARRFKIEGVDFDFYLVKSRHVIEFDGRQHFEPIEEFGGVDTLNKIKVDDLSKEEYCEEHFINLIRIKYDQYDDIYQILWENLKNVIIANNKI